MCVCVDLVCGGVGKERGRNVPGSSFLLAHSMRESSPSAGRCPIARGVLFPRKIEPSVSTMPHPSRAVGITKALEHQIIMFD